jgi:hypothetical protein
VHATRAKAAFVMALGLVACSSTASTTVSTKPGSPTTASRTSVEQSTTTLSEPDATAPVSISSLPTVLLPPEPGTVSGSLYFDMDADGVRDQGEPGLGGVQVSMGTRAVATDINGGFLINRLSGMKSLRVNTAWFRTQCDALDCPVGPGEDNDVGVENQLLYARDINTDIGARINVGLRPDWAAEDGYPLSTDPTDANPVDVAVRLSRIDVPTSTVECERGTTKEHLCAPGDHPSASLAIHNQGTEPISDIVVAIESAPGLRSDSITLSVALPSPPDTQPVVVQPYDPNTGTVLISVKGPLPPGSVAYYEMRQVVDADAFASPLPLPLANPYDRQVYARVVSIGTPGEVDSSLCDGWGSCLSASGPHNKLENFEEMDESGWNVQGPPRPSVQSFDFSARWADNLPTGESVAELTFTNTGTEVFRNVRLLAVVPDGVGADSRNSVWSITDKPSTWATTWPGQVSPEGTVTVQLIVPAGTSGKLLRFAIGAVQVGRHPEGPIPFPPSSVDTVAFNKSHVVELLLPGP